MTRLSMSCVAVAALLLSGTAWAQNADKGAAGAEAPGGAGGAGGAGGEKMLPGQKGGQMKPVPGAAGGGASPGMKPTPEAGKPAAGERKAGENAGVAPGAKVTEPAPAKAGEAGKMGEPAKAGEPAKNGEADKAGEPGKAGEARPAPKITEVQQTRITEVVRNVNVRPVNVNFHIGIGVAIPRTVVLNPLPREILTIVPAYEGYEFFVVPGQIVIVDPVSLDIVAVLPL